MTPLQTGTYELGPQNATLAVRTARAGAAARAGHDLVIHVTAWDGTLELGAGPDETRIALNADARSLRVREGTGGVQALDDDDRANIDHTIDAEVLNGTAIAFRSTAVEVDAERRHFDVRGDLTLAGRTAPIAFELAVDGDARLTGRATLTQSAWGIQPYSTLFGALKVADDVEVVVDAKLPGR